MDLNKRAAIWLVTLSIIFAVCAGFEAGKSSLEDIGPEGDLGALFNMILDMTCSAVSAKFAMLLSADRGKP